MTWWGWLLIIGISALNFVVTEAPEVAYKRGYRSGVRAYRKRLQEVVSDRDERRGYYPWRQPTGDQWADRVRRFGTVVDHECTRNMLGHCDDCGRPV